MAMSNPIINFFNSLPPVLTARTTVLVMHAMFTRPIHAHKNSSLAVPNSMDHIVIGAYLFELTLPGGR